jgi:hypothetical protein
VKDGNLTYFTDYSHLAGEIDAVVYLDGFHVFDKRPDQLDN